MRRQRFSLAKPPDVNECHPLERKKEYEYDGHDGYDDGVYGARRTVLHCGAGGGNMASCQLSE